MSVPGSNVCESFLAMRALVRFDPKVESNVAGQVGFLDELFGAVWTAVPGTSVDQHVLFEGVPGLKGLLAHFTRVGHVFVPIPVKQKDWLDNQTNLNPLSFNSRNTSKFKSF